MPSEPVSPQRAASKPKASRAHELQYKSVLQCHAQQNSTFYPEIVLEDGAETETPKRLGKTPKVSQKTEKDKGCVFILWIISSFHPLNVWIHPCGSGYRRVLSSRLYLGEISHYCEFTHRCKL